MDALGWQIGAVLIGASSIIIAIYVARLLDTSNKVVQKVFKVIDYNERHIHDTIENIASISESAEDILSVASKLTGFIKVFKFIKK